MFAKMCHLVTLSLFIWAPLAGAQTTSTSPQEDNSKLVRDLQIRVEQLQYQLETVTRDAAKMREEAAVTRQRLEADEKKLAIVSAGSDKQSGSVVAEAVVANDDAPSVDEQLGLLSAKVTDQYQSKIESGSRYRVKLSGLILLNMFENRGDVDDIENPALAEEKDPLKRIAGTFGGTMRQTQLNLDVYGPLFLGARSSGTVQMDFSGGFANRPGGSTMGLVRFRTGLARLDWSSTSIVAGQDSLFFLPESPTSFASLDQPALSYSGNLWAWAPQIRVERRVVSFAGSDLNMQAGLLDPVSANVPDFDATRLVAVGEQSRRPALAGHLGWSRLVFGQKMTVGTAVYRSRQEWSGSGLVTKVNSWLESLDWNIPFSRWIAVNGTIYRGRALGDIGGGIGQSVFFSVLQTTPDPPSTDGSSTAGFPSGLRTEGGWSQLKLMPANRWEFNAGFGEDNPDPRQLQSATDIRSYLNDARAGNQSAFGNVIFRPRSDLLLSAEFRHIHTKPFSLTPPAETPVTANHLNLAIGFVF